jgi:hypothetical protein
MSIGGDDGITLHKISKCADIKRKKNRHIDPDSLEILDPNPYPDPDLMNPDPQHFWAAELCIYLVSVDDIDLPHILFLQ